MFSRNETEYFVFVPADKNIDTEDGFEGGKIMKLKIKKALSVILATGLIFTASAATGVAESDISVADNTDDGLVWYDIKTVQEQLFDDSPSASGNWFGQLVNRISGSWDINTETKKGDSGASLKMTGANVRLWVNDYFASQLPDDSVYKITFDFYLASLPSNELGWDAKFVTAGWKPGIHIRPNGDVAVDGTVCASIGAGEWHSAAYILNTASGDYDCVIDGEAVKTVSIGFPDKMSNIQIVSSGIDLYADNIRLIIVDDEPAEEETPDLPDTPPSGESSLEEHKKFFVKSGSVFADFNDYEDVSASASLEDGMLVLNQDAGWTLSDNNSTIGADVVGQSLKIVGNGIVSPVPRLLFYQKAGSGSVYEVSFDIYYDEISPRRKDYNYTLTNTDNEEKWQGGIQIGANGEVLNNALATGKTISPGEWHTVGYFFDCLNHKVWHLFDGEIVYNGSVDTTFRTQSRIELTTADTCTYVDNVLMERYSRRPEAVKAKIAGYTAEVYMNTSIAELSDETDVKSYPVSLWADGVQLEAEKAEYVASENKFVITTVKPIITSSQYTVKIDSSVKSTDGVNVAEGYEMTFVSDSSGFDVVSVEKEDDGTIKAVISNSTDDYVLAVMVVAGKTSDGKLCSLDTTGSVAVGQGETSFELKPQNGNASEYEVFFIDDWSSRIAVERTIFASGGSYSGDASIKASFDVESNCITVSGYVDAPKDRTVVLSIAPEADVSDSDGNVNTNPFSEYNLPRLSDITSTSKDGAIFHKIYLPQSFDTGVYYIYADSEYGRAYAKFITIQADSEVTKNAVKECNTEASATALASYLDNNIENLGIDSESAKDHTQTIAGYIIALRPADGYSLSTLCPVIEYAIAMSSVEKGVAVDSVMRNYASVFGCDYADYAALSSADRGEFDTLLKEISASYKMTVFDELSLVASVRAASSTWGKLRDCVLSNADRLGVDVGSTSLYMSIASSYRGEVFEKMKDDTKKAVLISEIANSFEAAVDYVYNSHLGGGSGSGSGSGSSSKGSSSGGSFVNVGVSQNTQPVVPSIAYTDLDGHFSKDSVGYLSAKKIISGYPDGSFKPDNDVSRAEFSKMIALAFGIASGTGEEFADVNSGDWYYDYVTALSANSIIQGDGTYFYPSHSITRQDATLIISRVLSGIGKTYEGSASYNDMDNVSDYALRAVASMTKAGVIKGNDNFFYPQHTITRGEAAVMIHRAFNIRMEG